MNRTELPSRSLRPESTPPGAWGRAVLAAFVLSLATCALYWPAVGFRLLSFDDYYFTLENDLVTGGLDTRNIVRAFTRLPEENLFIPVTHLSLMADVEWFGMDPRAFHRTSVLLHSANMGILLLLLWRIAGRLPESAFAAAFVAFHPLRIESVAWMTERKGLLAALFLLLATAAWVRYTKSRRIGWYAVAAALFLLSLLSKPMAVMFPLLLLLLDWWPLGRFPDALRGGGRRLAALAIEKLPLLAASGAISLVTIRLQEKTSLHEGVSWFSRIEHALASLFVYLGQTAWPVGLAFRFFDTPWRQYSGSFLPFAVVTAVIVYALRRVSTGRPWLPFGLAWFAVAIFPNSGIAPSGAQWISDRFTYVPHFGIAVALAWSAAEAGRVRRIPAWVVPSAAALCLALLAVATRAQLPAWRDGATLFGRGLRANADDPRYRHQLAEERMNLGDLRGALEALRPVLPRALDPAFGVGIQFTHLTLLDRMGDRKGAIAAAREYLGRDPGFWKTRMLLADLLLADGDPPGAAAEYGRVLAEPMMPAFDRGYAWQGIGIARAELGDPAGAAAAYREGLRFNPFSVSLHFNLALLLAESREFTSSASHFAEASRLDPGNPRVRLRFAEMLIEAGDATAGALQFEAVARMLPGSAEASYAEGRALESAGMREQALEAYRRAISRPAALPETPEAARRRLAGAN